MFASSIPEIIDLIGARSKYAGEYKRDHGRRYNILALLDRQHLDLIGAFGVVSPSVIQDWLID